MCLHVRLSPGSLGPHTGTYVPPGFSVPVYVCMSFGPAGPRACVRACARARDTPHPPPPSVSGADDIGAEESDDKCPLSANEADDKWAGARAAPLRCNNRRWMA